MEITEAEAAAALAAMEGVDDNADAPFEAGDWRVLAVVETTSHGCGEIVFAPGWHPGWP